jgi:site-specific DNA-methyltransferase (adenine-specific)
VGDATVAADVSRLLSGQSIDLVLSDPPYGVDYVGKTEEALTIQNDGEQDLGALLGSSMKLALGACRPGAVWYIAAPAGPQFAAFAVVLAELGVWRQTLVWVKDTMVLGRSDYHYRHEAIFYGWAPGAAHRPPPDRTRTSVLEFDRPKASREHPTMKPLPLWAELVGNSTARGGLVYDPFAGSGTSIVACEQRGRVCRAMEIDPRYADVCVARWEKLTGRKAEREPSKEKDPVAGVGEG